jgi:sigma-E factor negative regulatory protein RseB
MPGLLPTIPKDEYMRHLLKAVVGSLLILLSPAVVHAQTGDDARHWLEKMANAVKTLNYEGNFVYAHGNQLELMRIIHSADENGQRERLLSLSGEAREIIRDNDALTCILPNSKSVIVEKSRPKQYIPEALLDITKNLSAYYDFKVLGEDRMTGRSAKVVAVLPRDPYRYGYRLWLDKETGMLLKSDLMDEHAEALEQFMFTSLKIQESIPLSELKPTTSGKGFKWYEDKKQAEDGVSGKKMGWVVTKLPGGFRMTMQKEHGMPTSKMPVEHMVFTDGLTSVSVFIEKPGQNDDELRGTSRMGAVNAYGTVISNHHVTVVGELPEAAVMMIGESVRYIE